VFSVINEIKGFLLNNIFYTDTFFEETHTFYYSTLASFFEETTVSSVANEDHTSSNQNLKIRS